MSVLIVQASVVMEPVAIGSEDSSVCVVQGLNQGQTTPAKVSKVLPHFSEKLGRCGKKKISTSRYLYLFVTDIDECSGPQNNCAFRCVNLPGTFQCVCPKGFTLAPDNSHCQGKASLILHAINGNPSFLTHKLFDVHLCKYHNYCLDVDECQTRVNNCRYACKNLVGTFMCVCPEGFTGTGDNCRGNEI